MGAIIDLTAAADPFHAELRSESFYVHTGIEGREFPARLSQPWTCGSAAHGQFTIPGDIVRAFRAALDDVHRQAAALGYLDGVVSTGPDTWFVDDADAGGATITGPAHIYGLMGAGTDWASTTTIEVEYQHLQALRDGLALVLD